MADARENYAAVQVPAESGGGYALAGPNWVVYGFEDRDDALLWLHDYLQVWDRERAERTAAREAQLAALLEPEREQ